MKKIDKKQIKETISALFSMTIDRIARTWSNLDS